MTLSIPADPSAAPSPEASVQRSIIAVCDVSIVEAGRGHRFDVPDLGAVAVFLFEGQYFITDDACTHGAASLSDGEVFGDEVECPFHQGAFNFRTGAPTARPCTKPLRTYRAQVCGEKVCVTLDRPA